MREPWLWQSSHMATTTTIFFFFFFFFFLSLVLLSEHTSIAAASDSSSHSHGSLQLKMVYRYSDEFRSLLRERNLEHLLRHDPAPGTPEFYQGLAKQDRLRHASLRHSSRHLASSPSFSNAFFSPTDEIFDFSDGNLGGLHYAQLQIGSPYSTFLVALDTGSDLLWVPCDCQKCASTSLLEYNLQATNKSEFSIYSPSKSKTSKVLSCSDPLCESESFTSNCTTSNKSSNNTCNYTVSYLSPNTSTSGLIVEDVIYLDVVGSNNTTTPSVYFGCGKVQTGSLLEGVAPNGLLGLGPDQISIPSTLARNGILSNSFSMCFTSDDGSSRLVFGSMEKSGFQNTSLVRTNPNVFYVVSSTSMVAGNEELKISQLLIFDTGTALTRLSSSAYHAIGTIFNDNIKLPQFQLAGIFDYCWNISDNDVSPLIKDFSIMFVGGSRLDIQTPYYGFLDSTGTTLVAVCLAIIKTDGVGIIGHNFMRGTEFIFNQDSNTLSWATSDCNTTIGTKAPTPVESPLINIEPTPSPSSPISPTSPKSSPTSPKPNPTLSPSPPTTNSAWFVKRVVYNTLFLPLVTLIISMIF